MDNYYNDLECKIGFVDRQRIISCFSVIAAVLCLGLVVLLFVAIIMKPVYLLKTIKCLKNIDSNASDI